MPRKGSAPDKETIQRKERIEKKKKFLHQPIKLEKVSSKEKLKRRAEAKSVRSPSINPKELADNLVEVGGLDRIEREGETLDV